LLRWHRRNVLIKILKEYSVNFQTSLLSTVRRCDKFDVFLQMAPTVDSVEKKRGGSMRRLQSLFSGGGGGGGGGGSDNHSRKKAINSGTLPSSPSNHSSISSSTVSSMTSSPSHSSGIQSPSHHQGSRVLQETAFVNTRRSKSLSPNRQVRTYL
jgi:hypothetical protein